MIPNTIRQRKRPSAAPTSPSTETSTLRCNGVRNHLDYALAKVDPETLKPPHRILRKHSDKKLVKLGANLCHFGMRTPMLVERNGRIVCGYARWLAAKAIGMDAVPVIYIDDLSPEDLRLLAIADNRSSEESEWVVEELKVEFDELGGLDRCLNLAISFFDTSEIDAIRESHTPPPEEDGAMDDGPAEPVTRPGDLLQLGGHRLLCGNALEESSYEMLLGEERAEMIFSDPPYNLPSRSISGLGKVKHSDFAMAAGEMSPAEFTSFLTSAFVLQAKYSADGSIHMQCMDWKHMREMLDAGEAAYSELKNLIIYDKGSGGMGTFYRSQHELIFAWKHGTAKHINNFGLGDTGRYRTNVWSYKGNNSFHRDRDKELKSHATVKSRALVADALRDCSSIGGIVLDVFGGSGTTLIAAELTHRRARLIELEPKFCDVTIRRWQEMTGAEAVLVATGQTFAEVAADRDAGDGCADYGDDEDLVGSEDLVEDEELAETDLDEGEDA